MCHVVLGASDVATDIHKMPIGVILVGALTIIILLFRLTPSITAAVALGLVSPYVAARPPRAGGQTEVNHMRVIVVGTKG